MFKRRTDLKFEEELSIAAYDGGRMTPAENEELNRAWAIRCKGMANEDPQLKAKADALENHVLFKASLRVVKLLIDKNEALESGTDETQKNLAAAKWLMSRISDGWNQRDDENLSEFLSIIF